MNRLHVTGLLCLSPAVGGVAWCLAHCVTLLPASVLKLPTPSSQCRPYLPKGGLRVLTPCFCRCLASRRRLPVGLPQSDVLLDGCIRGLPEPLALSCLVIFGSSRMQDVGVSALFYCVQRSAAAATSGVLASREGQCYDAAYWLDVQASCHQPWSRHLRLPFTPDVWTAVQIPLSHCPGVQGPLGRVSSSCL